MAELNRDQTLCNLEWFRRGIAENNCALFEAALFPARMVFRTAISEWLVESHQIDPDCLDEVQRLGLVDELIVFAFEHRDQWDGQVPPSQWLIERIPDAFVNVSLELKKPR